MWNVSPYVECFTVLGCALGIGARWSRKGAVNALVTPLPVTASPGTYLRATTCCVGRRVKGEVRLRRNYGQETSRPVGSGGSPHHDERCPGGAGGRAGTPASYQLSRPSRPDPERLALAESRRSTSGTERRHPDRPGCDRASSPSPSRRSRLCPRRAASPSPPPSSPSPSPSSPSRLLMTHKGIRSDALFRMNVSSHASMARRVHRGAGNPRRLPADCSLRKRAWKRCAAKSDFSPKKPSRPRPSPCPNRTTTNPGEMFHELRSRQRLRSTWPKRF